MNPIPSCSWTNNTFLQENDDVVVGGVLRHPLRDAKSIGTPNIVVPLAAKIQIWVTILSGVAIASLVVVGVASVFPSNIPIVFELRSGAMAVASILLIGFIGGLVSIRYSLRVEPLIALGLGS